MKSNIFYCIIIALMTLLATTLSSCEGVFEFKCQPFALNRIDTSLFSFYNCYQYTHDKDTMKFNFRHSNLKEPRSSYFRVCEVSMSMTFEDTLSQTNFTYEFHYTQTGKELSKMNLYISGSCFYFNLNYDSLFNTKSILNKIETTTINEEFAETFCFFRNITLDGYTITEFETRDGRRWKLCGKGEKIDLKTNA